ncbi:MAG: sulfatase-like hydrolase/transferase [Bacteroidota bacterium]
MKNVFFWLLVSAMVLVVAACNTETPSENTNASSINPVLTDQPNILWLVVEDLSPYLPMFGDSTVETPNLSRLAAEGVCYDYFFSPAAVCAPARSAIATGLYPTHLKSNHMRTGPWFTDTINKTLMQNYSKFIPDDIVPYEATPAPEVKMMSEYLRRAGYYCTNNAKRDYQFISPVTAWDENNRQAHFRNRKEGQPFFAIFNFEVTHESRIWAKAEDSLWVDEDLAVEVPPYLPDTDIGQQDVRRMYSNIKEMDVQIGRILDQLEKDSLLENTIVFWYSDHGGPLPRQKRLLYDSGIHVPLIIRYPQKQFAGQRDSQLLSFVDLAPTTLSLAGIEPLEHMDGRSFLGKHKDNDEKNYVFAAADRFDELYDANRAVRDRRYKYIRYYNPEKPMLLRVQYRDQMPIMQELHRLNEAEELTEEQAFWFRKQKPEAEFFDTWNDPHELKNLIDDPKYQAKIEELRTACEAWMKEMEDDPLRPEQELVNEMWGKMEQPITAMPDIQKQADGIALTCSTEGASIGYKFIQKGSDPAFSHWQVYTKPFELEEDKELVVKAHRIGYRASDVVRFEVISK